jgi:hypothetical protein
MDILEVEWYEVRTSDHGLGYVSVRSNRCFERHTVPDVAVPM